nr:hypothetical protein [Mycobacterium parmense]
MTLKRYRLSALIGQGRTRRVVVAAAAAVALAPFSALATTTVVAQAAPCAGAGQNPMSCEHCLFYVNLYHTSNVCFSEPVRQAPRTTEPLPEPVRLPEALPPAPPPPNAAPVPIPSINPLAPGTPRNASLVIPPKGLEASPQAVAAARAAPAARVDPNRVDPVLQQVDFNHQVQNVVNAHADNVDVVKAGSAELARPRHWDYVDYDEYRRPSLYNPLGEAMTFCYFYDGAEREAYVPAGGRIVLDAAAVGLVPFTAVGDSHVASGSFYGGAWIPPDGFDGPPPPGYNPPPPPPVYQHVYAYVLADNQTVDVGRVQVVGRDDSQPTGSQETFLLDDSTLAWGQVNDSDGSAQITVTKTQPLPGVGPTDNGTFLVALAAHDEHAQPAEPARPAQPWWPQALGYGLLGLGAAFVAWIVNRRQKTADPTRP